MLRCSKRLIANHYIYPPNTTKANERLLKNLDLLNHRHGRSAEVHLNNPVYGNMLNNSMISSLHRTLMSMELDTDVRSIIIQSQNDFCLGTDYLYLAHKGRENPKEAEDYLRRLYSLIFDISKLETPMVPLITGRAYGAGATIMGLSHFAIANEKAQACFPEAKFGFIPTGGSSYLLSRMPGEVGLYLAMTGQRLKGTDLQQLNLVHSSSDINESLNESIHLHINSLEGPYNTKITYGDAWQEAQTLFSADKLFESIEDTNEIANRTNIGNFWRDKRENVKMVVADVLYNSKVKKDALEYTPGTRYKDFAGQRMHNYLQTFELSAIAPIPKIPQKPLSIQEYLPAIYRCFSASTIDELIERLVYESKEGEKVWAESVLANLSEKSPLGLEITFRMMKNAYNLEWHECLQQEFKIATELMKHPDFFEGATKVLGRIKGTPEWKSKGPISPDLVKEITESPVRLEIDAKPNQLLPVKEYYEEFPNSPRFWINEISPTDTIHRGDFELEARNFFNSYGIDLRDHNLEIPVVRSKIFYWLMFNKRVAEEYEKVEKVSSDKTSVKIFIERRLAEIEKLVSDEAAVKKVVEEALKERFKRKFNERMELIASRSLDAHNIKKRELYKEMKDVIHEKVFMEDVDESEDIKKLYEVADMAPVPMTFPKSNDESYLPPLVNQQYGPYTPDSSKVYTADVVTTDDSINYYLSYNERFLDKSEFDIKEAKTLLAEIYSKIELVNHLSSDDDEELVSEFYEETRANDPEEAQEMFDNFLRTPRAAKEEDTIAENLENIGGSHFTAHTDKVEVDDQGKIEPEIDQGLTDLSDIDSDQNSVKVQIKSKKSLSKCESIMKIVEKRSSKEDLIQDVFVKTGCEDLQEGLRLLSTGEFDYDPVAMKERRRKLISRKLEHDDKYYMSTQAAKMKKQFTEYFIQPRNSDLSNQLYKKLEVQNSKLLLHELETISEDRSKESEPFIEEQIHDVLEDTNFDVDQYLNEVNDQKKERHLKDFAQRVKFDADYLKIIFGEKAYIPLAYEYTKEDLGVPVKVLGACDYRESPQQWLRKALKESIDHLFDQRQHEEMQMTHAELLAYDQDLMKNFTPKGLKALLTHYLNQEISLMLTNREGTTDEFRKNDNDNSEYMKPSNDYQDYLNSSQEFSLLHQGDKLSTYARRYLRGGSRKTDLVAKAVKHNAYLDLLEHERDHNLLSGPKGDPAEYIDLWKVKDVALVGQKRESYEHRKRDLRDLKEELIRSSKVIKSMEQLLEKYEYRKRLDNIEEFNEILKANNDII